MRRRRSPITSTAPPLAKEDHWAKDGVGRDADDQLVGVRPPRHRLYAKTGERRTRPRATLTQRCQKRASNPAKTRA